ncbi:sensor histidine kinase [Microbacterium sp.]|uniref:sensor histidine kinase n=1 Tax=Microbacterium sp. TaxID=51671 RepID=UPI003C7237B3
MPDRRSRSAAVMTDDDLRLPRPPGVLRRFWARHPVLADVLLTAVCLLTSVVPVTVASTRTAPGTAALITGTGLLACLSLLRRRRWPLIVFGASILAGIATLFADVPLGGPLIGVAAYGVAVYRSTRACIAALVAGLGAILVVAGTLLLAGLTTPQIVLNAITGETLIAMIGALIGINVGNRKRYVEAIIDRSRQLLIERDQQAQLAAAAERSRIAREMHDIVSHSLTVVVALAEGATATSDADRARQATSQIADTARDALREMRSMLGVLRDGAPDAPLDVGDADPVDAPVAAARRAGFPVTVHVAGRYPEPVAVRRALARIVQESLTNAMRHATGVTEIELSIVTSATETEVTVRNDGVVTAPTAGGYGIRGLRERVEHVGGTLEVGPEGPGRWRVHARLPLTEKEDR